MAPCLNLPHCMPLVARFPMRVTRIQRLLPRHCTLVLTRQVLAGKSMAMVQPRRLALLLPHLLPGALLGATACARPAAACLATAGHPTAVGSAPATACRRHAGLAAAGDTNAVCPAWRPTAAGARPDMHCAGLGDDRDWQLLNTAEPMGTLRPQRLRPDHAHTLAFWLGRQVRPPVASRPAAQRHYRSRQIVAAPTLRPRAPAVLRGAPASAGREMRCPSASSRRRHRAGDPAVAAGRGRGCAAPIPSAAG